MSQTCKKFKNKKVASKSLWISKKKITENKMANFKENLLWLDFQPSSIPAFSCAGLRLEPVTVATGRKGVHPGQFSPSQGRI